MKACNFCIQEQYRGTDTGTWTLTTNPLECEICPKIKLTSNDGTVGSNFKYTHPSHDPYGKSAGALLEYIRTEKPVEGTKNDTGKPQLSLLTRESLEAEAAAFAYGAKKYDKNNYKKGMAWSRVLDAAFRHLTAFNGRENNDLESGLSHLAHAKACLAMLIYYEKNKIGTDDR